MRIVHGTVNAYVNQRCRCELCRASNYTYHKAARERRYGERVLVDGVLVHLSAPHGLVGGYTYYGCRCAECQKAHARSENRRRLRRMAEARAA